MVGARLKSERKRKKLSQQELAAMLNLHYKSISAYEREVSDPDDKTKLFFAQFFNVSLDYLMGLTDERVPLDRKKAFTLPDDFPEHCKSELYRYAEMLILYQNNKDK